MINLCETTQIDKTGKIPNLSALRNKVTTLNGFRFYLPGDSLGDRGRFRECWYRISVQRNLNCCCCCCLIGRAVVVAAVVAAAAAGRGVVVAVGGGGWAPRFRKRRQMMECEWEPVLCRDQSVAAADVPHLRNAVAAAVDSKAKTSVVNSCD